MDSSHSVTKPCCRLDMTDAVEDYLKALYHLSEAGGSTFASALAERLGVSLPSASAMIKRLEEHDLVVRHRPRELALTAHGAEHAVAVVRRHRLLETFLAKVLDLAWDEVHDEAEVLEHVLSPRLEARIDAVLGYPTRDPHGDPIPPRSGDHHEQWPDPLGAAPPGSRFLVERVSDRDSAALRHLGRLGIRPGTVLDVERRDPFGGPLWVGVEGSSHPLGAGLTALVHGTVQDGATP